MVLALSTGYPHAYPQLCGLVVIMYVIGHSLCYPMGYVQPSIVYASSKLRARLAGPPYHRRTLPAYLGWVLSTSLAVKTKGACQLCQL